MCFSSFLFVGRKSHIFGARLTLDVYVRISRDVYRKENTHWKQISGSSFSFEQKGRKNEFCTNLLFLGEFLYVNLRADRLGIQICAALTLKF